MKRSIPALNRVLVTVQGPDDADSLLALLEDKPFRQSPAITIMTVCPQPQLPPWPVPLSLSKTLEQEALEKGKQFTEDLAERLSQMDYTAHASVELGIPASTIAEQEHSLNPDLVMLGSHGKRGLSRFLLGSVSTSVLHQVNAPVLIVRTR